ncbi:hypothetical protein [Pelomonas sp. KK5]|uniref:hypothetical protein n=1 Tax=Pelomonas sp. KK5 TaxID=1855730 RepID=UPI00097C62C1|nr:hypothetical protein [Pelomonas sp. KK5]
MNTTDLRALASAFERKAARCEACMALVCPGWESMPAGFDAAVLERVGTLRDPADEDPTLAEHHPNGTHGWSAEAPIAPAFFPYNRCDVWRCRACARPFLRYTEYGGYYQDERVRELDGELLSDATP